MPGQCWADLSVKDGGAQILPSFAKQVPYVMEVPKSALLTINQSFIDSLWPGRLGASVFDRQVKLCMSAVNPCHLGEHRRATKQRDPRSMPGCSVAPANGPGNGRSSTLPERRAWGTVREDYSADGKAWKYFPYEHARMRAYRWNGTAPQVSATWSSACVCADAMERARSVSRNALRASGPKVTTARRQRVLVVRRRNPTSSWLRWRYHIRSGSSRTLYV